MGARTYKLLPRHGRDEGEVLEALKELRRDDVDWRSGRAFSQVFPAGAELADFAQRAYMAYFTENGLNTSAFPSQRRMQAEVVSMTARLLGGDDEVVGNMTAGGVESIFMAVRAARRWARRHRPKLAQPEMVLPRNAHPAFAKAGNVCRLKPVHVGVDSTYYRSDVRAVTKAVNERTVLIVGSAPSYPQGIIDVIPEMGRLAEKQGILCHVDANLGGFVLPFLRTLEYPIPPFDFGIRGVTSLSVDLHAYGNAAQGTGVILYRDSELRRQALYANTDWPGGIYGSSTLTDALPGGAVASAWAVMHRLGMDGYCDIALELMGTTKKLRRGISAIEGLRILGDPHMSVMAIASRRHNVYELADFMAGRGWHMERQQFPACIHLTVTRAHCAQADAFLRDLDAAARATAQEPVERILDKTKHFLFGTAVRVLPKGLVSRVSSIASERLGVEEPELPTQTASLYGVKTTLPNRADLRAVALETLDKVSRFDATEGEILPSLEPDEEEEEEELVEAVEIDDAAAEIDADAEELDADEPDADEVHDGEDELSQNEADRSDDTPDDGEAGRETAGGDWEDWGDGGDDWDEDDGADSPAEAPEDSEEKESDA